MGYINILWDQPVLFQLGKKFKLEYELGWAQRDLITAPSFVVEKRGHKVKVVQAFSWEGESETGEELNPVQWNRPLVRHLCFLL